MWESFYKNIKDGKFHPGQYRGRQLGSGVAEMYARKPHIISVDPHLPREPEVFVGKRVTPVTVVVDRAKSEMCDVIEDDKPHEPITCKKRPRSVRSKRTVGGAGPKKRQSRKPARGKTSENSRFGVKSRDEASVKLRSSTTTYSARKLDFETCLM